LQHDFKMKRYRFKLKQELKEKNYLEYRKMKEIKLDYGFKIQMEEEGFGSQPTIRKALRFETNTEIAKKIRQKALQLGGYVMESEKVKTGK
jgi:hypothetical protein